MSKAHKGQHVMAHQHGYRTVVHDQKTGERVYAGPWVITGIVGPTLFNHDEGSAQEEQGETAQQEAAEDAQTTSAS